MAEDLFITTVLFSCFYLLNGFVKLYYLLSFIWKVKVELLVCLLAGKFHPSVIKTLEILALNLIGTQKLCLNFYFYHNFPLLDCPLKNKLLVESKNYSIS